MYKQYHAAHTLEEFCNNIESTTQLSEMAVSANADPSLRINIFQGPLQQAVISSTVDYVFYECVVVAKDDRVLKTKYISSLDYIDYVKEFNPEDYGYITGTTIRKIPTLETPIDPSDVLVALSSGKEVHASMPEHLYFVQNKKVQLEKIQSTERQISYKVLAYE